jgi:hypothetical protein
MVRYWADANVFIWGSREPYPFDRARGYWTWFDKKLNEGIIVSHVKVYQEVIKGRGKEDPILQWMKTRKDKGLALGSSKELQAIAGRVCTVAYETLTYPMATKFCSGADPFLIAAAAADGGIVVTQESKRSECKMPAVCKHFEVICINLFEMNHQLNAEFGS